MPTRRSWRCASTIRAPASPTCSTRTPRSRRAATRWSSSRAATTPARWRSTRRSRRAGSKAKPRRKAPGAARPIPAPEGMEQEIERRLSLQAKGSMLPFTVFDAEGRVAGMTTYMNIDAPNRRVEIGSTWYARRVQRTALNTECKLMLLTHAFERLDCIAVEFRTHFFNRASRKGIERLGAKLDGILRSHQIGRDGALRDTVVYSIIAGEWPAVRQHLKFSLEN